MNKKIKYNTNKQENTYVQDRKNNLRTLERLWMMHLDGREKLDASLSYDNAENLSIIYLNTYDISKVFNVISKDFPKLKLYDLEVPKEYEEEKVYRYLYTKGLLLKKKELVFDTTTINNIFHGTENHPFTRGLSIIFPTDKMYLFETLRKEYPVYSYKEVTDKAVAKLGIEKRMAKLGKGVNASYLMSVLNELLMKKRTNADEWDDLFKRYNGLLGITEQSTGTVIAYEMLHTLDYNKQFSLARVMGKFDFGNRIDNKVKSQIEISFQKFGIENDIFVGKELTDKVVDYIYITDEGDTFSITREEVTRALDRVELDTEEKDKMITALYALLQSVVNFNKE